MKLTLTSCSIKFVIGDNLKTTEVHLKRKKGSMNAKQYYFLVCNLQYHVNSGHGMDLLHIVFILHIYIHSSSLSVSSPCSPAQRQSTKMCSHARGPCMSTCICVDFLLL